MKYSIFTVAVAVQMLLVLCNSAFALNKGGRVAVPSSSIEKSGDLGKRAHTTVRVFIPERPLARPQAGGPPFSGYVYETPASLACVYDLTPTVSGCNPNSVTTNPSGGSRAIAIVDAYHDPHAASDLAVFSAQFGLPAPSSANFQVVFASGRQPPQDPTGGWELEESLDIEWAHAMAPEAKIYLVEAASSRFTDLFTAVKVASNLVSQAGGGEVTMSWGGSEFSGESAYDRNFTTPGVVYIAASGDSISVLYPAASPNVAAAGGTTIVRGSSAQNFAFSAETTWVDGGAGPSLYENIPSYQYEYGLSGIVGTARGVPDFSADADPSSGVWVYDSTRVDGESGPWWIVGGTSASTQILGGILNSAATVPGGVFASSTTAELDTVYANLETKTGDFFDITSGNCGPSPPSKYSTENGWDFCTGVGSPRTYFGK